MLVVPILAALSVAQAQAVPPSFKNILIASPTGKGFAPCEPSIAVSKKDPHNIVAGVILDRAIYTKDGGVTWKESKLTSPYGVFGDPAVISDPQGNFLFFTLTSKTDRNHHLGRILSQRSTDGGATWTPSDGMGFNPPAQQDKEWAIAHPTKPNIYTTWTQFDKYGAKEPQYQSNILFSMSSDSGKTWGKSVQINDISGDCIDDDGTTEGAVPAVGPDGTVYVTWSNGGVIYFDKSKDDGKTWLPFDRPIARQFGGWNMNIPGINRSNGMPVLMADVSKGKHRGSLYLIWGDQRNGESDSDIVFMYSRDGGEKWSQPAVLNKDKSGKHQFLPWLAIDDTTGYLYAVYYDRRAHDDLKTDVYVAFSTDGGQSFTERKISESPFIPQPKGFFGDYNNISAHGGVVAPVWTRMDDGRTTVWTAVIRHPDLVK